MATIHQDAGGNATGGLEFWTSITGTVTVSTDQPRFGPYSLKHASGAGNGAATVYKDGVMADAGRRISVWVYLAALPSTTFGFWNATGVGGTGITWQVRIDTNGKLALYRGVGPTLVATGTTTVPTNTWFRVSVGFVITSGSVNDCRVYLNGTLEATGHNVSVNTGSDRLSIGWGTGAPPGANYVMYTSGCYTDDGTAFDDVGGGVADSVHVACKHPAATNTNNFDTTVGTGTNRWDYVDEVPLSESNGLQHAAATDVQENFGLEAAADGDTNLTGATIIARTAWAWAKRGALTPCTHRASAAGGGTNPSTTDTITIGAGTATGDALYVLVTSRDHTAGTGYPTVTDDDSGGNAWARISESPDGSRKATLWWKRATAGTASKTITVAGCVGSMTCGLTVFQNAATSADPHTNLSVQDNASGTESHATITATNWGSSYVFAVSNYNNDNAVTSVSGATVGSYGASGRWEKQSTAGSDCAATIWSIDGADSAPVATGAVTWSQTNGVTTSFSFAVRPETLVGSPDIMDNGTETAITLTATSALYTKITDSASYPSDAAGIGLRSTTTALDTFLYECGTIIAYTPASTGQPAAKRMGGVEFAGRFIPSSAGRVW